MATNSGVRIERRGNLARAITLYAQQVPDATQAGMEDAIEAGAREMLRIAEAAVTPTGELRHPATPGRHETGALVEEIIDSLTGQAGGAIYRVYRNRGGNISIEFGFLDADTLAGHSGNPYIAAQELGTGEGGEGAGRGHGIPAMHAVQAGFNVAASQIEQDIARQLEILGRDSEAGRFYARAQRQAVAR